MLQPARDEAGMSLRLRVRLAVGGIRADYLSTSRESPVWWSLI